MSQYVGPTPLLKSHDASGFDCGKAPLNTFLIRHAYINQQNDSARTFVVLNENRVIAYYSLAAGAIEHEKAPDRMSKGLARHPIPILLMARLAVDKTFQGQQLASALIKDALKRYLNVCGEIGARAFVVHAKDDDAKGLYEHFGMTPFTNNPLHLYYLKKDIDKALGL